MTAHDRSRRRFIGLLGGATAAFTVWPTLSFASTGSRTRLLVVLLRGAMDGLHLLPPRDDADYRRLRGALAVENALPLDAPFGLHPALPFAHGLYGRRQLLPVVAVAPPYRQRSHFDAQDCLENGTATPGGARDGWLGRCVEAMAGAHGVAVAQVMPLAMRGSTRADLWSPDLPRDLPDALLAPLETLYAHDAQLAPVFADAMRRSMDGRDDMAGAATGMTTGATTRAFGLVEAMAAAAKRMQGADAARIAFVEDTGWDTHRAQAPTLQRKFGELDAGLRALHDGLGAAWDDTVVVIATEFGRTVAVNGTAGTDHGVGGVALLAGGAVRGGRVLGDWPGLRANALQDGRDLRATTDLRAVFKGVLASHLALSESALETRVFPDSREIAPLAGLA